MPTICSFRGIKLSINWQEHLPPHFHAEFGEYECIIGISELEKLAGDMPNRQLKMILGWAALHQEELTDNWYLAQHLSPLFSIEPLK